MTAARVVHASGPGVEIVRYASTGYWYVEQSVGARRVSMNDAARQTVDLLKDGGTWSEACSPLGARFDAKVRKYGGTHTVVEDCPLSAAIRRGAFNDALMWAVFDDMARIVDRHPELVDA